MEELSIRARIRKQVSREDSIFDWQNFTALDPSLISDSYISQGRDPAPSYVFALLMVSNLCLMVQYLSIQLYVSDIPGNKFTNGIMFGIAEIFGMALS